MPPSRLREGATEHSPLAIQRGGPAADASTRSARFSSLSEVDAKALLMRSSTSRCAEALLALRQDAWRRNSRHSSIAGVSAEIPDGH
jgi:hypothetical protein